MQDRRQNQNPYQLGTPIEIPDRLYGRDSLFQEIKDNLQNEAKFILLHGQRRVGKTSVLKIIPFAIAQDEFLFVDYDCEIHTNINISEILYGIFTKILQQLAPNSDAANFLLEENLDLNSPENRKKIRKFTYQICEKLISRNIKLVLLLDEFDVVNQKNIEPATQLLHFLRELINDEPDLYMIAVVGRYLNSMPELLQIFKGSPFLEIGLLNEESSKKLIEEPTKNRLEYYKKTIDKILYFSSGHPYYTQVLCHELFKLVRYESNPNSIIGIIPEEVDDIISNALESAEGGLGCFWDGLNLYERVVVSIVAEAQEENSIENALTVIEKRGLVVTPDLEDAIRLLIEKGFLDSNPIKVKIELVRLWLLQRHKLRDEIRHLEEIHTEENQLLTVARSFWEKEDKKTQALELYETVLKSSPNNFRIVLELAEKSWMLGYFDKALPLYERAYKLDKLVYQQRLIDFLNEYGDYLQEQGDYRKAKEKYESILIFEPTNILAQNKIGELTPQINENNEDITEPPKNLNTINVLTPRLNENNENLTEPPKKTSRHSINLYQFLQRFSQPKWLGRVGVISLLFIGISIFIYRQLTQDCQAEQEKNSFGVCVTMSSISSGDRTFFRDLKSDEIQDSENIKKFKENREKGINNFKQEKYQEAAIFFKEAADSNRNDPEVLIYYNNALARKKGKPYILAVAVPATHHKNYGLAREILRGIAQAQDEFNKNDRLNQQLLEIVIVDDGDSKEKAETVAKELVKNNLILGVIGHNASSVTERALPIYETEKIPLISSTSTSINLKSFLFFRTLQSDIETGNKLAQYAIKHGYKQILVLCNPGELYSDSIYDIFSKKFINEKEQRTIINDKCVDIRNNIDQEFKEILPNIQNIQAIAMFPDTNHLDEAIKLAQKFKEKKSGIQLLGGDSVYTEQIFTIGGDYMQDLILAIPWFRDTKKSRSFADKAELIWGGGVSWRTATSYDAVNAFLAAIKLSSPPSKETILNNLKNVEVKDTSFQETLRFNKNRETPREATLVIVKNKKFESQESQTQTK